MPKRLGAGLSEPKSLHTLWFEESQVRELDRLRILFPRYRSFSEAVRIAVAAGLPIAMRMYEQEQEGEQVA